jgi:flagellar M-ring protein FliF
MPGLLGDPTRMRESVQRFASGFSRGQKAVTILAVVAIAMVSLVFMSLSGKPTYAVLFTNLQATDAASITQELATNHIPYQLESGGSTILVPQNDVDQERLVAASAGLPSQTTTGLSILDKEGLGASQLTQQADYLQAIQGELEQTIDSISGVTSSEVNVALPANQTFALGDTNPTGASVLVNMDANHTLTYEQVQAIVSLTSSAVPGLTRGEVTVADSNGDLLAGPGVNDDGSSEDSTSTSYDSTTASKVEAYLATVLGVGNADVQVDGTLNFNSTDEHYNLIVPAKNGKAETFCSNTSTSKETYAGTGAAAATPTATNTVTVTGGTNGNGSYNQSTSTKTCSTQTETENVTVAPGGVVSQSVAVLINSKALPKGTSLTTLKAGVAAAAGIDKARGDVLSFGSTVFPSTAVPAVKPVKASMLTADAKPGLAVLLLFITLFLLWRASRRARKAALTNDALFDSLTLDALTPRMADAPTGELPAVPFVPIARRSGPSIQEIVDAQSEEVASVLRDWLHQPT